jgi:peptide/nickel transport system ATP-binding protein
MTAAPLLDVKDLEQRYALPRESLFRPPGQVRALNGVNVRVAAGRSLGIVGESGSGKSTLLRAIAGLAPASEGSIRARPSHASSPSR